MFKKVSVFITVSAAFQSDILQLSPLSKGLPLQQLNQLALAAADLNELSVDLLHILWVLLGDHY